MGRVQPARRGDRADAHHGRGGQVRAVLRAVGQSHPGAAAVTGHGQPVGVTIIDATSGDSVVSSGATQTFTAPAETEPDPNPWVDETVPFTATSTSTTVTFTSEDANSCSTSNIDCPANAGPIITDVRTLSSLIR
jgi:hypothetical protein